MRAGCFTAWQRWMNTAFAPIRGPSRARLRHAQAQLWLAARALSRPAA
jgi:hypothetical protein